MILARVRIPVASLLCATLPFAFTPPAVAQPKQARSYSGEVLFRGLLFADGPVAERIPELQRAKVVYGFNRLNAKQLAAVRHLEQELINRLKRGDPRYFDRFQRDIQSGDHRRVQKSLNDAGMMVSAILYRSNKGLESLLDPAQNRRFRERLAQSSIAQQLRDTLPALTDARSKLGRLNDELLIDRDVYINTFTNRYVQSVRYVDKSINKNLNIDNERAFAIDRNLDVFNFLDVNRNLYKAFDRVNVNRSVDNQWNPVADVTVEIETAVYAVVAVAVFVVLVYVVGRTGFDNDRACLWQEQLVHSVATRLSVH